MVKLVKPLLVYVVVVVRILLKVAGLEDYLARASKDESAVLFSYCLRIDAA